MQRTCDHESCSLEEKLPGIVVGDTAIAQLEMPVIGAAPESQTSCPASFIALAATFQQPVPSRLVVSLHGSEELSRRVRVIFMVWPRA